MWKLCQMSRQRHPLTLSPKSYNHVGLQNCLPPPPTSLPPLFTPLTNISWTPTGDTFPGYDWYGVARCHVFQERTCCDVHMLLGCELYLWDLSCAHRWLACFQDCSMTTGSQPLRMNLLFSSLFLYLHLTPSGFTWLFKGTSTYPHTNTTWCKSR